MRVVILTAVWQRHGVTALFWAGVRRICMIWQQAGIDVQLIAVGSHDMVHAAMAAQMGAKYLNRSNRWLGRKWNAGLQAAKALQPDYVMKLDSDDLLGNRCARAYVDAFRAGDPYIGLRGCYFYDLATGDAIRWDGYTHPTRLGEPVGFGRAVHSHVLNILDWTLWDPHIRRNLDGSMTERLTAIGVAPTLLELPQVAVDCKSETNLSPFEHLEGKPANAAQWRHELSAEERNLMLPRKAA